MLGHGGEEDELAPRLVEKLVGKKVAGVAAGRYHTLMYTVVGHLYTCGHDDKGQLGHGEKNDELVPRQVKGLVGKKVVGVAVGCTASHSVVCTADGGVYSFGNGTEGQLGNSQILDKSLPCELNKHSFGRVL